MDFFKVCRLYSLVLSFFVFFLSIDFFSLAPLRRLHQSIQCLSGQFSVENVSEVDNQSVYSKENGFRTVEFIQVNEIALKSFEKKIESFSSLESCLQSYLEEFILNNEKLLQKDKGYLLNHFVFQLLSEGYIKIKKEQSWDDIKDGVDSCDFPSFYLTMLGFSSAAKFSCLSFNDEVIGVIVYDILEYANDSKEMIIRCIEMNCHYRGLGCGKYFLSHFIKDSLYSQKGIDSVDLNNVSQSHNSSHFNGKLFYSSLGVFFDCEKRGTYFTYSRKKTINLDQHLDLKGWKKVLLKDVVRYHQKCNQTSIEYLDVETSERQVVLDRAVSWDVFIQKTNLFLKSTHNILFAV